jgi:hypothetical protein
MYQPQRTETERTNERIIGWVTTKPIKDRTGKVYATPKSYEVIYVGNFKNDRRFYETNEIYERHEDGMIEHVIIVESLVDEWEWVPCVVCGSEPDQTRLGHPVCNLCRSHPMIPGLGINRK